MREAAEIGRVTTQTRMISPDSVDQTNLDIWDQPYIDFTRFYTPET